MENKRTIRGAIDQKEKVYFYLPTEQSKQRFAQWAGDEGFVTQSARNAAILKPESIMSVHSDSNTVYFCGMQARAIMAAKSVPKSVLRVDFEKYSNGDPEYAY